MRILAKAPNCLIHVEHCRANTLEELNEIIRGKATLKDIGDDIALVYDPEAKTKYRAYNCTIAGEKVYGKIAFVRYQDHRIKELHFKQDPILKEQYPEMFAAKKKGRK